MNETTDIENFARSIESILGNVPAQCADGVERAVEISMSATVVGLRTEYTDGIGLHPWSEEYRGGFHKKVDREGFQVVGEIGNTAKPGLVHLLEKGHATLTERRTRAYPHMAPAFDDMIEDVVDRAKREIGRSLS